MAFLVALGTFVLLFFNREVVKNNLLLKQDLFIIIDALNYWNDKITDPRIMEAKFFTIHQNNYVPLLSPILYKSVKNLYENHIKPFVMDTAELVEVTTTQGTAIFNPREQTVLSNTRPDIIAGKLVTVKFTKENAVKHVTILHEINKILLEIEFENKIYNRIFSIIKFTFRPFKSLKKFWTGSYL